MPQPVALFGTEEQKQRYLPRCARGEISAFLLTESDVGSDPARLNTTAVPSADGSEYVLNGVKLWATNGVIADLLPVALSGRGLLRTIPSAAYYPRSRVTAVTDAAAAACPGRKGHACQG